MGPDSLLGCLHIRVVTRPPPDRAPFFPEVGAHLLKATRSQDLDAAFETVFSEYLSLKIDSLERSIQRKEEKWGMEFSTFKRRLAEDDLPGEADSYRVEQDFWE